MIHHLSVAARDPKSVAEFFAELTGGVTVDFPPNPGGYMAFAPDGKGTAVEVYPAGSLMIPNSDEGAIFSRREAEPIERSPTHFAISVARSVGEVTDMARARGWDCFICDRGGHFHVMEVWVENAWLVEVLPPQFAEEYLGFANAVTGMADPNAALSTHQPQAGTLELV
jgi:catechol 2,3-dioxygenase-like lactoylglutathione lyase family enzyme